MLLTGKEYLESIQDGRVLYVGGEKIKDVTQHIGFKRGAQTFAALYEMKADPALRELFTYEENGDRYSMYYLQPRSQDDLRKRSAAHKKITEFSLGLMGRTPDTVAGNITGLTMNLDYFKDKEGSFPDNLLNIYNHMRKNDIFATYAIVPPQGARDRGYYQSKGLKQPALRVTKETDAGVILNGMKMLATGAAYAHEVLIGNIMPLAPDQGKESITCVIPLNLAGLELWARTPFNRNEITEFDAPLTYRYDESDCMLIFHDVFVPWEKVLVHDNAALSRGIYVNTPAHVIANHQSNVRVATKLRFMLSIASLVTKMTGAREIPAVRDTLGRLAAMEAGYAAMVDGQIEAYETLDNGYAMFNRRYLYAAVHWAMENHSAIIDTLRELMGGGHFQFPADSTVFDDPELADVFDRYWSAGDYSAKDRMKLFKLAWDLVGSDLASRATSYEKFFVGPAFAVRNYNFMYTPWDDVHAFTEDFMQSYDLRESRLTVA